MSKRIDLIGQRFGRLVVIGFSHVDNHRASCWHVECDCGNTKTIRSNSLRNGDAKSCGCLQREISIKHNQTHGMSGISTYASWKQMKARCLNKKNDRYEDYGGRGIKVCERWLDIKNFYEDMGDRPKGLTLERIDNDGNYEPSNCKWATREDQQGNKRNNRVITYKGKTLSLSQWARELNINQKTLTGRLNRGWPIERALTERGG